MRNRIVKCCACAALATLVIAGCTSREWYESANTSAKFECNKLQPGAREECMAKVNKTPYDTYEKERSKQSP